MRTLTVIVLGSFLVAAPARSAVDFPPPTELEIEARIKAVQQQQQDLKSKEEQLRKELADAKARPFGGIKAEVSGILKKDASGHYILTRAAKGEEVRVWLKPSDPQLYLLVTKLLDKEVTASGAMLQQVAPAPSLFTTEPGKVLPTLPSAPPVFDPKVGLMVPTQVPDKGMYLEQFKIEEAIRKAPK